MTAAERAALQVIARSEVPINNPMALAAPTGMSLPDARAVLDALSKGGLIDWQPASRGLSGVVLSEATWRATAKGLQALNEE